MSNKIWRRALHQRKIWKDLPLGKKMRYYVKPFAESIIHIWFQPLPFPTILKVIQTIAVIVIALIPIIYPVIIVLWTYAEAQLILKRHFNVELPKECDLISYVKEVVAFEVTDDAHAIFLSLYLERWRFIVTIVTSSIDYMRMAFFLLLGFGE